MVGWTAVQLDLSGVSITYSSLVDQPEQLHQTVRLNTTNFLPPRMEGGVYLAAPERFLSNSITSYGGLFTYTFLYLSEGRDRPAGE